MCFIQDQRLASNNKKDHSCTTSHTLHLALTTIKYRFSSCFCPEVIHHMQKCPWSRKLFFPGSGTDYDQHEGSSPSPPHPTTHLLPSPLPSLSISRDFCAEVLRHMQTLLSVTSSFLQYVIMSGALCQLQRIKWRKP